MGIHLSKVEKILKKDRIMNIHQFKDHIATKFQFENWNAYLDFCKSQGMDESEIGYDDVMIDFAKYHVELALKAVSENSEINYLGGNSDINDFEIDKKSILESYPLTNIK